MKLDSKGTKEEGIMGRKKKGVKWEGWEPSEE